MEKPCPLNPKYIVHDDGRVVSTYYSKPRTMKTSPGRSGYHRFVMVINKRHVSVLLHQIVLITFVGPRPSPINGEPYHAAHLDGNNNNNNLSNLRWVLRSENEAHKKKHGKCFGISNKLKKQDVLEMLEMFKKKYPHQIIAKKFKVKTSTVRAISHGKHWSWLTKIKKGSYICRPDSYRHIPLV